MQMQENIELQPTNKQSKEKLKVRIVNRDKQRTDQVIIFDHQDQIKYEGNIKKINENNKKIIFQGKGKLYYSKETFFEGTFKNGQKVNGTNNTPQQKYTGKWDKNMPNGMGKLQFKNGEFYEGNFKDGRYHGKGTYKSIKQDYTVLSKGEWCNGLRDGQFQIQKIYKKKPRKQQVPQLSMDYKHGYMHQIDSFDGTLKDFGFEQRHSKLLNFQKIIPEIVMKPKSILKKTISKNSVSRPVQNNDLKLVELNQNIANKILHKKIKLQQIQPDSCAICLTEIENDQNIKVFPCEGRHVFHSECINQWLSNHKFSCPECRYDLSAIPLERIIGEQENIHLNIEEESDWEDESEEEEEEEEKIELELESSNISEWKINQNMLEETIISQLQENYLSEAQQIIQEKC